MIKKNRFLRWNKLKIYNKFISYQDFNVDNFNIFVLESFKVNVTYSILLKIKYNGIDFGMGGKQVGFKLNSINSLDSIKVLFYSLVQTVDTFIDRYECNYIDFIQIMYLPVTEIPRLKLTNVAGLKVNKEFTRIKSIKEGFTSKILPLSMNLTYYGTYVTKDKWNEYLNIIDKQNNLLFRNLINRDSIDSMYLLNENILIINYKISDNIYIRKVFNPASGVEYIEAKDQGLNKELTKFERSIGSNTMTIDNDRVKNVKSSKVLPSIKYIPTKYRASANPFIGTLDLETYVDADGYSRVYALGYYIGDKNPITYYLAPNQTSNELVLSCIDELLVSKFNNYIFYIHNSGRFDFIFLLKIIKEFNNNIGYDYYKMSTIYRDNKILKMGIKHHSTGYKISLVDSYNIVKASLKELCKAFKLEVIKGDFPHKFVKKDTLYYIGNTPDISYWGIGNDNSKMLDYKSKTNWNLQKECIYYLEKDLTTLYNIINLFSRYMFTKYGVQVSNSLTISRLAMNIFLKKYLKNYKLPIIKKGMYADIKHSYFGGITEVYKPYGKNLYYYDVNSLYPYAALNAMPGCNCVYMSELDGIDLKDLFGFFYCEIECNNKYLGLLPYRSKFELSLPNGKWNGWYFSEELKFAYDNGYKIKVIKGYNFDKSNNVFKEYIEDTYKIKKSSTGHIKAISKSLLNNLLGRFGLDINKPLTRLVNKEQLNYIICTRNYISIKKVTDNDYLVTYYPEISKEVCDTHGLDYYKVLNDPSKIIKDGKTEFREVSLTTASAVTSYARIYMSKIKLEIINNGGKLYYTDTDSIVTNIPLNSNLVNEEIGKFKMEHLVKEGFFISGKLYCLVIDKKDDNGNNEVIIKSKQVIKGKLTLNHFKELYKGNNVDSFKHSSIINLEEGSVSIGQDKITINSDSYTKRSKVYSRGKWTDTKPLYVQE